MWSCSCNSHQSLNPQSGEGQINPILNEGTTHFAIISSALFCHCLNLELLSKVVCFFASADLFLTLRFTVGVSR